MSDATHQPPFGGTVGYVAERAPLAIQLCLYSFVASVPFEGAWLAGDATNPLFSISRITGVALLLVSVAFQSDRLVIPSAAFCYLAYVAAVLLVAIVNGTERLPEAAQQIFMLCQMLVLLCLIYSHCRSRRIVDRLMTVMAASVTALALLQLTGYVGQDAANSRVSAFQEDPNTVGATFAIGFIVLAWKLVHSRPWVSKVLVASCMSVVALALTRTGSRGALIAMVAATGTMMVTRRLVPGRSSSVMAMCFLVGIVAMAITQTETMAARLHHFFESGDTSYRSQIWSSAADMILEKPLIGWGAWRNYEELGHRTGQGFVDTHNTYLLVVTQAGLVGALPYLAGIAMSIRGAIRARRDQVYGIILPLLVCVLIVNLDLSWHNRKLHWVVMALALAAGSAVPWSMEAEQRVAKESVPHEALL